MSHNNQPHTWKDQLDADRLREERWEHLAQAASGELNIILGDAEFEAWKDETRDSIQLLTWKEVYFLVEAKITATLELRAYMDAHTDDCPCFLPEQTCAADRHLEAQYDDRTDVELPY